MEVVDWGLAEAFDDVSVPLGDVVDDGVGEPGIDAVNVGLSSWFEGDMTLLSAQLVS
jgi:hypothetical protein